MSPAERRRAILDSAKYLRNVRPLDPAELADYVEGGVHPGVVRQVLRESAVELRVVERADGTFVPVPEDPHPGRAEHGRGPPAIEALPEAYARRVEDRLVSAFGRDWHRGEAGERLRTTIRRLKEDYYRNRDVEYDREVALGYAVYHLADFYAAVQYVLDELAAERLFPRDLRILDVGAGVGGPALGVHDLLFGPPDADGRTVAGSDPNDGPGPGAGDAGDPDAGDADDPPTPPALVDYHAVEPSAAADLLEELLGATDRNFHATVHRTTAEAFDPGDPLPGGTDHAGGGAGGDGTGGDGEGGDGGGEGGGGEGGDGEDADVADVDGDDGDGDDGDGGDPSGGFDLICFANVLSELADPVAVARRYVEYLAPTGAMVLLAPADRETSTGLRRVERALADGEDPRATVYSPTVRLWPDAAPTDEGWSFDERPPLATPSFQRKLDEAAGSEGEFTKTAVRYSYATLRVDGRRRIGFTPDPDRFARMADAESYVTERIDLVGVKLSHDLGGEGARARRRSGRGATGSGAGSARAGSGGGSGDHNPLYRVGDGSESVDHYAVLTRETALNGALREADYGDLLVFEGALALWNDDEGAYNLVVDEETVVDRVPAGAA